jgi:hypothetical protein
MRIILCITFMALSCAAFGQIKENENQSLDTAKATSVVRIVCPVKLPGQPLYFLNGKRIEDLNAVDPNQLGSVDVLKDSAAVALYGESAKYGVVIMRTKDQVLEREPVLIRQRETGENGKDKP